MTLKNIQNIYRISDKRAIIMYKFNSNIQPAMQLLLPKDYEGILMIT